MCNKLFQGEGRNPSAEGGKKKEYNTRREKQNKTTNQQSQRKGTQTSPGFVFILGQNAASSISIIRCI